MNWGSLAAGIAIAFFIETMFRDWSIPVGVMALAVGISVSGSAVLIVNSWREFRARRSAPARERRQWLMTTTIALASGGVAASAFISFAHNLRRSLPAFEWPSPTDRADVPLSKLLGLLFSGHLLSRARYQPEIDYVPPLNTGDGRLPRIMQFSQVDYVVRALAGNRGTYYLHRDGFCVACPMELIDPATARVISTDGRRLPELNDTWDMVRAFFKGRTGRSRVILFVVSTDAVAAKPGFPSATDAELWSKRGFSTLPVEEATKTFQNGFCQLWVYEFERRDIEKEPRFLKSSTLTAEQHLNALLHEGPA